LRVVLAPENSTLRAHCSSNAARRATLAPRGVKTRSTPTPHLMLFLCAVPPSRNRRALCTAASDRTAHSRRSPSHPPTTLTTNEMIPPANKFPIEKLPETIRSMTTAIAADEMWRLDDSKLQGPHQPTLFSYSPHWMP
jgi:hypothetical protein